MSVTLLNLDQYPDVFMLDIAIFATLCNIFHNIEKKTHFLIAVLLSQTHFTALFAKIEP